MSFALKVCVFWLIAHSRWTSMASCTFSWPPEVLSLCRTGGSVETDIRLLSPAPSDAAMSTSESKTLSAGLPSAPRTRSWSNILSPSLMKSAGQQPGAKWPQSCGRPASCSSSFCLAASDGIAGASVETDPRLSSPVPSSIVVVVVVAVVAAIVVCVAFFVVTWPWARGSSSRSRAFAASHRRKCGIPGEPICPQAGAVILPGTALAGPETAPRPRAARPGLLAFGL
mmetsp:Transcript_42581/g.109974  ORF Transcript_42581/g.109974 Transcript_42581/m.109974 type:complete len:227 (-) Transcript_42581:10-690(-)